MGFVMKSILPKACYPSACRSPARSGLAVAAHSGSIQSDRGSWGRQCTNKHSWHWKQTVCAYRRTCEAPHLFPFLEHLRAAGGVQSISVPSTFLMFLFPYVGCTLERKTWIYATLFPEIQEKEMGLLNKIALIWEFLRGGCTVWQCLPLLWAELPVQGASVCESTRQGWGLVWQLAMLALHGNVRSALSRACGSPEKRSDHSVALHFCSVTDCSSSGVVWDCPCEKLSFGEKQSPAALSEKALTSREGHLCCRHSTAQYLIDIHSQGCVSCPSCGCLSLACNSHRYSQWGLGRQVCLWCLKEAGQYFRRDFLYVITTILKQQKYSM